ncbi:MAG: hypothetical protein GPOALKHO_000066 [Sodalis sp.]|uniref:hypothetical protein n=1 Tax=Sodalis sp. (in: enterobacteria) TaxID=1898979 RepID=UPI003873733D|nr:MAG: hypothetical protein GPOALKHO_000066 [Sodalis sp.]
MKRKLLNDLDLLEALLVEHELSHAASEGLMLPPGDARLVANVAVGDNSRLGVMG